MNEGSGGWNGGSPCDAVRDVLPDLVAASTGGALPPVSSDAGDWASHLAACPACAAELDFLRRLEGARPSPPDTLATTIVARALSAPASDSGSWLHPTDLDVLPFQSPARRRASGRWWASSSAAAAVLVLAAGLGLVARGGPGASGTTDPPEVMVAMDAELSLGWSEEWIVAGAPYLDAVSDETLAVLAAAVEP